MIAVALLLLASVAAGAALAVRHRRAHRPASLSPALDPMPAGVKHLASTVSDLSDLGAHLRGTRAFSRVRRPRLGAVLDLRQ